MAKLLLSPSANRNSATVVALNLKTASTMWSRMRGLLGTAEIPAEDALWIHACNSVHTLFMNYPIDIIFVNKDLKICALESELSPWRMVLPKLKASSVFEMAAGSIVRAKLKIGDQLYVDP